MQYDHKPTRPRGIFVTGTDTGVGKTVVAAGLVHLLAQQGRRVVGLKPVASGADSGAAGLRNQDALALAAAGSVRLPYEMTNPFCFEPAIAPHLAARDAGTAISIDALEQWYAGATVGAEIAIVEGAGGWRVPLHPAGFLSDLPERLSLGVILVVGLRLGCLNHARLTLEAIAAAAVAHSSAGSATGSTPGLPGSRTTSNRSKSCSAARRWRSFRLLETADATSAATWLDRPLLRQAVFPPQ